MIRYRSNKTGSIIRPRSGSRTARLIAASTAYTVVPDVAEAPTDPRKMTLAQLKDYAAGRGIELVATRKAAVLREILEIEEGTDDDPDDEDLDEEPDDDEDDLDDDEESEGEDDLDDDDPDDDEDLDEEPGAADDDTEDGK